MKRNAIIIAAGMSSRFVPLSFETPKGLLEVCGEVLIERQIRQLKEVGIDEIILVCGYMAEKFAYLREKFGVEIVFNEDYAKYNNISSVIRVVDKLDNTFICCSDHYYKKNPFIVNSECSVYSALYAKGDTEEYCLSIDSNDMIQDVVVGGRNAWYMAGYAYLNTMFSQQFRDLLVAAYKEELLRQLYWEDVYVRYIHELPMMRVVKMAEDELYEFDSLDELRLFDKTYLYDTRSSIIKDICRGLKCKEQEVCAFRKVVSKDAQTFTFQYKEITYQYINGELSIC